MITLILRDDSYVSFQNEACEKAEFYGIKDNWMLVPETVLTKKFESTYTASYIYLVINKKFLQPSQVQLLNDGSISQIRISDNIEGTNHKTVITNNMFVTKKEEFETSIVLTFIARKND